MAVKSKQQLIIDLHEIFTPRVVNINEYDSKGKELAPEYRSVLGIFEGVFFVPDGKSLNGRFYTKKFWEVMLSRPEIIYKLENLLMYGCIGHKETPVTDDDLNEGRVSHIITALWIGEDGLGYGRALVLNTKAGKNLWTYLNAGSKLKMSSRGAGEYKENETIEGLPVVDENNFYLDTWDVVKEPGFPQTNIEIVKNNVTENINQNKESNMSFTPEQLAQIKNLISEGVNKPHITNEANVLVENTTLKLEVKNLTEKLQNANQKAEIFEKLNDNAKFVLNKLVAENRLNDIAEYFALGTPEEIKEGAELSEALADRLEAFTKLEFTPESAQELVTLAENANSELVQWKTLGKFEEAKQAMEAIKAIQPKLEKLGNLDEAIKALEQVKTLVPSLLKKVEAYNNEKLNLKASELAEKFNKPLEDVKKHLKNIGESETVKLYSQIAENPNTNKNKNEGKVNPVKKTWKLPTANEGNNTGWRALVNTINEGTQKIENKPIPTVNLGGKF